MQAAFQIVQVKPIDPSGLLRIQAVGSDGAGGNSLDVGALEAGVLTRASKCLRSHSEPRMKLDVYNIGIVIALCAAEGR